MSGGPPIYDSAVAAVFASFEDRVRLRLLDVRTMIFETAERTPGVGPIEETLKWGQPAYLTAETKAGSTLRLGVTRAGGAAVFVHCRTTIIADLRHLFPHDLEYDGNRAAYLPAKRSPEVVAIRFLIERALTYHRR